MAHLAKCWAECRLLLARAERREADKIERYRKKQFDRLKYLSDHDFGSYQDLVDEAKSRWDKMVSAVQNAEDHARAVELDLAVAEAQVRLEAARLERAVFRLTRSLRKCRD
jgi:hypothetical protein